jgi:hypothetical protein
MDADRFDALLRSLSHVPSRRGAVRLVAGAALGGAFGWLRATEAEAKKRRKKKGKKKRRCAPQCAGKTCGPDGCGRSCGWCAGGACEAGICTCPPGTELCGDVCRIRCADFFARDPDTCGCCKLAPLHCVGSHECCSGFCAPNTSGLGSCQGRAEGEHCRFDWQCRTATCTGGVCRCPGDSVPCKGNCRVPCESGQTRNPDTCGCCTSNGSPCAAAPSSCCAGANRCTGAGNTTCAGLGDGDPCTFNAQCASRFGCNGGTCGLAVGE